MNEAKTGTQANADPSPAAPQPASRRLAKSLLVVGALVLLNASSLLSPSTAQGNPCLVDDPALTLCPATPAPDPAATMACVNDAVTKAAAVVGNADIGAMGLNGTAVAAEAALAAVSCCPCPPPCGQSIVSDSGTLWTHYNEFNVNEGADLPAVPVVPHAAWSTGIQQATWGTGLPVPQYIWTHPGGNPANHAPTRLPVMFEREFPSCIYNGTGIGQSGVVLNIIADDAFLVVFNGQVLSPATPPCDGQVVDAPDDPSCFNQVHTLTLPPLVNAGWGSPNNKLVVYVWNHDNPFNPNPGMLRYRLDY